MPKLKRTSENQITKDNYDRDEEDSRFSEEPDPGIGMKRASDSVIQGRKIIKASRKFAATSSAAAPPPKAAVANAFASTKLVPNNDNAPQPPSASSSNPFASVQLKSGTTAAPPSFSFGAPPKTEPKPFSFASTTTTSLSSSTQSSSLSKSSKPKGANNNAQQIETINRNLFQMIQDHVTKGHICTDLSPLMEQYMNVVENLQSDLDDGGDGHDDDNDNNVGDSGHKNNGGGSVAFQGGSSSSLINDANKSQPSNSFSGFSFASSSSSSAPPPSSKTTTFSFTGGSATAPATAAAAAVTAPAPSFSFGAAQPATTSTGGGSNNASSANNEDDPTFNPDDGKLEVGQEENKDEETLYEVRARLIKLIDGKWNKSCTGPCRLYRNTLTDKKRMVLRNDVGKVMLNVSVGKGMPFKKVSQKTKKGEVWHVSFMAVEEEGEGAKQIMLNVKKEDIDKFHEKLESMAA